MKRVLSTSLLLVLWLPSLAQAAVPTRVGYQGRLLRSDGTPEVGTATITFAIYAAETGGTPLWSETQAVALTEGFYTTLLGATTPLTEAILDGSVRWLELTVAGTVLQPRQQISSVAYALRAGVADPGPGSVGTAQLADGAVTGAKLAGNSVTGASIVDGSVTAADLDPAVTAGGIPAGVIVMWSGTAVPAGWALCDGLNGTPNLQDRFVVGAGSAYAVGASGGAGAVTLAASEMPGHGHSASSGTAGSHDHTSTVDAVADHGHTGTGGSAGGHGHGASVASVTGHSHSGSGGSAGDHAHSGTVVAAGAHYHGYTIHSTNSTTAASGANSVGLPMSYPDRATSTDGNHAHSLTVNSAGSHAHTVSVASGGGHGHTATVDAIAAHAHSVSVAGGGGHGHTSSVGTAAAHGHSVTVSSNGGDGAHENRPPYFALAYIMKL